MARPKKTWSPEQVSVFEGLCRIHATQAEICEVLSLDKKTLARLIEETYPDTPTWEEAFERFSAQGRVSLRRRMFAMAEKGDKTMLIYLSKQYLGMSDTPQQEKKPEQTENKLIAFQNVSKVANA